MNKLLIFGCGGFVGRYLAEEFSTHGYEVYGTDLVKANDKVLKYVVDYNTIDLLNYSDVENLIKKVAPNYIINLAAISSVRLSWNIP